MKFREGLEDRRSEPGEFNFQEFKRKSEETGFFEQGFDVIHVTGTNGKGSVCNLTYSILREAGYSVGVFTGPPLIDLPVRIEVDGELISEDEMIELYSEIQDEDFSRFEILVLIALRYFQDSNIDIAVIEAGLGGKRDATNIVSSDISVITNVALEHVGRIGNSIEEIAEEKAGIIERESTCVTGSSGEALEVIKNQASKKNSELKTPEKHVKPVNSNEFKIEYDNIVFQPSLRGKFQLENINLVLEALKSSEYHIKEEDILEVLENVKLPFRMEEICRDPDVVLDRAHNPHGFRKIVESADIGTAIYGFAGKDNCQQIIEILKDEAEELVVTKREGIDAEKYAEEYDINYIEDPLEAVKYSTKYLKEPIIITGSISMLKQVRKEIKQQ